MCVVHLLSKQIPLPSHWKKPWKKLAPPAPTTRFYDRVGSNNAARVRLVIWAKKLEGWVDTVPVTHNEQLTVGRRRRKLLRG